MASTHVTGGGDSPSSTRQAERFGAYAELVEAGEEDKARKQYPAIARHLDTGCISCNNALKEAIAFVQEYK